jgi:Mg2+/Co2+ transporter CorC
MEERTSTVELTVDEVNAARDGTMIATLIDTHGGMVTVPLSLLPPDVAVNQVIIAEFRVDPDAADARARRVRNLQHRLFNRDSGTG